MIKKLSVIAGLLAGFFSLTFFQGAFATTPQCQPTQAIEEGPFYLSNSPKRSDVTDGQPGVALSLKFRVVDTKCKAIKGARVDIWYANADGVYSGVASKGDDVGAGTNSGMFLRGTQVSDSKGYVTF